MARSKLGDLITRAKAVKKERGEWPAALQGVTKETIKRALAVLGISDEALICAVFALLDDGIASFWKVASPARFCDGATTAQIGCHIGILQNGRDIKLDREGRDVWIKPFLDIGAFERVTLYPSPLDKKKRLFVPGHLGGNKPTLAYRLDASFVSALRGPPEHLEGRIRDWASDSEIKRRLVLQAEAAEVALRTYEDPHGALVQAALSYYVPRFLPGYELLALDAASGERRPEQVRDALRAAGVADHARGAMPDALLWKPGSDNYAVIEAVISDGEVDINKIRNTFSLLDGVKAPCVHFVTCYRNWRDAGSAQKKRNNLLPGTFLWIATKAALRFRVEAARVTLEGPSPLRTGEDGLTRESAP